MACLHENNILYSILRVYFCCRDELRCLLKDLQIPILAEKELKALFNELDPDQEGAIGFDNFYGC